MAVNNAINSPSLGGVASVSTGGMLKGVSGSAMGIVDLSAGTLANPAFAAYNGTDIVAVEIVDGTGTTVTKSGANYQINAVAGGLTWQVGPNGAQAVTAGQGWFVTGAGNAFTLPADPSIGQTVEFAATTANSYTITAGASDTIVFGNAESAATGVLTSDALEGTAIRLVAVSASQWCAVALIGSFTSN